MSHRLPVALLILSIPVFGATQARAQGNVAVQASATATSPAQANRILTKDPEYLKLLTPPLGDDFLRTYSKSFREKSAEIEGRVGDITDENLRNRARRTEWSKVLQKDRERFSNEAGATFNQAKISFLQKHRDNLFEVGTVSYDGNNNSLVVKVTPTAPIDANFRVVLKGATINQIYDKFRQIAASEIDQTAREYIANAGAGSNCSRNPDWCLKYAKEDIEEKLRSNRMMIVAQGDLADRRIDRVLLVDYDTEVVLLDIDPHISALNSAAWRFSVAPVSTDPAHSLASPEIAASTESSGSGNTAEPAPSTQVSPTSAPARIRVPGQVTAATIVTRTKPIYPSQARANHIQGEVLLHAIIDKEGKISEAQVLSGDDLLGQSALEAVREWRYKPMLYDGEPTEVDTTITITFSLAE